MQTKPLAIYLGTACFLVAGIAGATWASFRNTKPEQPLFLQSGEVTYQTPTVDWPAPSSSEAGSVAYLKEWMTLVSPVVPQPVSSEGAAIPQEVVRDVPDDTVNEKRSKTKAASSQRRRHERDAEDDDGERIQTTGQGSEESERAGEQDRRSHRNRRARQHKYDEDGDRTVGLRYRREPPRVRMVPAEPERGGGLFGIFDSFHNGW